MTLPSSLPERWTDIYNQVPLCDVPRHYAGMGDSPFLMQYLQTVLRLCPPGGRVLETGIGSGYSAIWLSRRRCLSFGLDISPRIVERARQINTLLEGQAQFFAGDLFGLYDSYLQESTSPSSHGPKAANESMPGPSAIADLFGNGIAAGNGKPIGNVTSIGNGTFPRNETSPGYKASLEGGVSVRRFDVIYHQGVLEHFTVPQIRAALAQQVACSQHVVFSVPSVNYPFEPEFGDERLLPLAEWERILAPFDVLELKYYGDPQHGEKEHVLAVLRGQPVTPELIAMMQSPAEPYPEGISAIVHTRNEASRLEECLRSLQGWTDEIIVCDMESSDETVAIAERFTNEIVAHPLIANFDRARNVSAMRARYRWIFYLDADERVPLALGAALRELTRSKPEQGLDTEQQPEADFDALLIPFRHHFAGHWLRCLYPGYTMPRLFRNGRFHFNARLHAGAQVEGKVACFPAGDPNLALVHYSYDSLAHYLDKLNRYTDGEAANMHRDGAHFTWQSAIQHWVKDFSLYFDGHDRGGRDARQDGVHGLLYAFLSGFYRFEQHAKLYEKRFHAGQLQPGETSVPASVEELLEYALRVLREKPVPQAQDIRVESLPADGGGKDLPAESLPVEGLPTEGLPTEDLPVEHVLAGEEAKEQERAGKNLIPTRVTAEETVSDEKITEDDKSTEDEESAAGTNNSLDAKNALGVVNASRMVNAADFPAIVWSGPLLDPSGYGEESRQFVFGLDEVINDEVLCGTPVGEASQNSRLKLAVQNLPWSNDVVGLTEAERALLDTLSQPTVAPGFIHITQNFPLGIRRHPQAGVTIGRTMFETDRLPLAWVQACNRLDYVWVPTEFNRQTFAAAGVAPEKLAVIPGCLDPYPYRQNSVRVQAERALRLQNRPSRLAPFRFLTIFDWTRHKGWDVLLHAFIRAFEGRDDVSLTLKVWSTMGYGASGIREQAAAWVQSELGHDLMGDGRITFLHEHLSPEQLRELYYGHDTFVMPSRGEGWGRPLMEAMASGLPAIGTDWSGNCAFMNPGNSYLVRSRLVPVPEIGWREIPTYQGHRWAEPDAGHLAELLQRVVEEPAEAGRLGSRGQEEVLDGYDRRKVARLILEELERIADKADLKILPASSTGSNLSKNETGRSPAMEASQTAVSQAEGVPETEVVTNSVAGDMIKSVQPVRVRWEGAQFSLHSLGLVNRELCLELAGDAGLDLSLVPSEPAWISTQEDPRLAVLEERFFKPLAKPAQVHVRHAYPPCLVKPDEGRWS